MSLWIILLCSVLYVKPIGLSVTRRLFELYMLYTYIILELLFMSGASYSPRVLARVVSSLNCEIIQMANLL